MSPVWPLCFKYTGPVLGKGFIAHIEMSGRLLAVQEAAGVWLNGVTPAAIAVGAANLEEAGPIHRDALTRVFIDFAEESESFEQFETKVQEFFHVGDDDMVAWEQAIARVNDGKCDIPDGLARCPDPQIFLKVTRRTMEQVTPADNPILHRQAQHYAAAA